MKAKSEVKIALKNQKSVLIVKSDVKAGPPLIIRRGEL
jgi:hypothetical protein